MRMLYLTHIVAGGLGLATGYLALYAVKGGGLHRRSGMLFVVAMLTMCTAGMILAATRGGVWTGINFRAGLLTAYLVFTSLTTVRPLANGGRIVDIGAMLVALGVGAISLTLGFEALGNGGTRNGVPAFPFFLFGVVGLVAGAGDARMLRSGALRGSMRIARHLWRMSFALFIAAMSFFLGQAKVFPKPMRIYPLLALPVLAVLVTMLYWLWRVRFKRSLRGMVVSAPVAARTPAAAAA